MASWKLAGIASSVWLWALTPAAFGQTPESAGDKVMSTAEMDALDLEGLLNIDLMSMPVSVATKTTQSLRKTAGVVTVVTREEIERTGARDLLDILHHIGRTGTRGVEAELKSTLKRGFCNVAYSYYYAGNRNTVELYSVPGRRSALLGSAQHKFTALGSFEIFDSIYANPGLIYLSARATQSGVDADDSPLFGEEDPIVLLNFGIMARDVWIDGLDVSLNGYNLLHQPFRFVQPYAGSHAPLPGLGTEVALQVGYRIQG